MPEVEITRKQIMVVDKVGTNSYGDLTWTDKENKPYKVKSTRKQYFEAIVSGQAVEISYAKYKGNEYPYSVVAIEGKLPTVEPTHLEKTGALTVPEKPVTMTKSDWSEKDRITRKSIERQTALNAAIELAKGQEGATISTVILDAQIAEFYLETGALKGRPQAGVNPLVEEAKKLGAKQIDPDHIPY